MTHELTPDRWAAIQRLFHQALDRAPEARAALLGERRTGDPDLVHQVESLLEAHQRPGLLDLAGATEGEPPRSLPERIGQYQLLRPLGEGGMGVVYLARREGGDFTQLVALKILRSGLVDPRLEARLRAERRLLARLEHPGIARLIDGGATPGGQPYYVMEYVEGTSLLVHCDSAALGLRERIGLFLEICNAVHHAHQQLVIHRDLKPGNVCITRSGRPKLLDFGIAKALDPDTGEPGGSAQVTGTIPWCTPAYASPEQIRGQQAGTPSDIYSLGVILYQLFTGRRPYAVESAASPRELERLVCEVAPPRPSSAGFGEAEAAARGSTPDQLRRSLAGDLDTIVQKAMAVDTERRYASVEQLADDLRRYLSGQPVLARPDSLPYRLGKFIRRHRIAVTAAAVVLLALVAGVATTAWQATVAGRERDRAEAALAESQDVTGFLIELFQASAPEAAPGDTAAAREILRRGVTRVDELADRPLVQAHMLDALGMVFVSLGQYDRAQNLIERGLATRLGVLDSLDPEVGESYRLLGRTYRARAHYPEALEALRRALDIKRRALGPADPGVIQVLMDLGFLMPYLGRTDESARYYHEALGLWRQVGGDTSEPVASALLTLAAAERRLVRYHEAAAAAREAIAIRTTLYGHGDPKVADAMITLGDILAVTPTDRQEAEQLFREAIAVQQRAFDPVDLARIHGLNSLADLLVERGEGLEEAEGLYREILDMRLKLLGPVHPSVALSYDELGEVLQARGRLDQAVEARRRGLDTWRRAVGPEHAGVAGSMGGMADLYLARGELHKAEALWREAIAMRVRLHGPDHPLVGLGLSHLGMVLTARGSYPEAEQVLLRALRIQEATQPAGHPDRKEAHRSLAVLYRAMGRSEEAAEQEALADD